MATPHKRKPRKCPQCGNSEIATIVYGFPVMNEKTDEKIAGGKIILGGCAIEDGAPKWKCNVCEHEMGQLDFGSQN